MSVLSTMYAGVSGMSAQANALSAVSDNIANSGTVGYKDASTQFSDMLTNVGTNSYSAGGVQTSVQYNISSQGVLETANSPTDIGIQGNGFFLVNDASGVTSLTRAGSFTQNSSGDLTNAAGYTLMGYSKAPGSTTASDGVGGLVPINLNVGNTLPTASTTGTLSPNLPSDSTAVSSSATLPSANSSSSTYTNQTSLDTYDNLGNKVTLDIYYTNISGTTVNGTTQPPNTWEMDVYNKADATATTSSTTGPFPYTSNGTNDTPLYSGTLTFSPTTGSLTSASQTGTNYYPDGNAIAQPTTSQTSITLAIPNTSTTVEQGLTLNLSNMTQLASAFSVNTATTNGNAPSAATGVVIATDGTLSETYADGSTKALYTIPLGTVPAEDELTPLSGNVYTVNSKSGNINVGTASQNGFGTIQSSELESSTVDLATQLTNMIVAQRGYEANSKVFQTGSDLLSQLNNMLK